ncbi:MAG: ABC transporter ATP-binding protein [Lachnospira sp.]|nr:ABC transporter ATP-binding protein [Lachnospira sp.]
MGNKLLEVKGVRKEYKNFTLDGVSFDIEPGEVVGLIGRNGAGKTTIIKLIMNMIKRNGGGIDVCGLDNIKDEIEVKNIIGYVSDDDYLFANAFAASYVDLFTVAYKEFDKAMFEQYATKWELPLNKQFKAYSKGMKLKTMLAFALSHNPKILILDEPTAGLDPVSREEVLELFREFVADGEHSVLFSTHITSDLDKIADKIVFVDDGAVIENTYTDDLLDKYVMVSGSDKDYEEYKEKFIGVRKTSIGFTGMALRRDVADAKNLQISQPNIENIMVYYTRK